MKKMNMYSLTISPQMVQYPAKQNQTLFDILLENGVTIDSPCGGKGTCGKCKVQIIAGNISEPSSEERDHLNEQEIADGIRLSCQCFLAGDLTVSLMGGSEENHQILSGGYLPEFEHEPNIIKAIYHRQIPQTRQYRSYFDLAAEMLDISDVADQPVFLQSVKNIFDHDRFTAVYADKHLIGLEGGDSRGKDYGLAVDIGTTTVVVSLIDLNDGSEIDSATGLNPQKSNGQDVLSRIEFTRRADNGLGILHQAIVQCLNTIIDKLCTKHHISKDHIYEATVAANTTMLHLLLGVDPAPIGKSPYIPVFTDRQSLPASSLGLHLSPFGRMYCLPGVSGYIGADIVAGVTVCRLDQTSRNVLFIDIGTNGEIVLSKGGTLYACACAAGPALEGMNISCGMLAGEGAVERVKITDDNIFLKVIGESRPKGLCGSGIIEVVSEIARVGLIQKTGRLKSKTDVARDDKLKGLSRFIKEEGNKRALVIDPVNHILVTQADIRQVQLAKGAILSGIHALVSQLEMKTDDLDEIIISGQFGRHLHVDSLVGLGLVPQELQEKVTYIGNSSQTGAMMCLLSTAKRREVEETARKISYFELTMLKDYEKLFSRCLKF